MSDQDHVIEVLNEENRRLFEKNARLREECKHAWAGEAARTSEREQMRKQRNALLAALREIDIDKLDLLADWFDQDDANKGKTGDPEVQRDLRAWARSIRTAISEVEGEKP